MLPIIQNEVLKGSIIHSDEWPAYNGIGLLGFTHMSVNHSKNYVENGIHTNTIEACWGRLKTKFLRIKRGVSLNNLDQYLIEEWYRLIHGKNIELLSSVLKLILSYYY